MKEQVAEIIKQVYNDRIGEDWIARAAAKINQLFEPKGAKPPVLSDEEIDQAWPHTTTAQLSLAQLSLEEIAAEILIGARKVAEVQRDDTWQKVQAYYEPIIQQMKADIIRISTEEWKKHYEAKIEQAKAEVAREIKRTLERFDISPLVAEMMTIPRNEWVNFKDRFLKKEKMKCKRCGQDIEADAPVNVVICGSCADDLRQEEDAMEAQAKAEDDRANKEAYEEAVAEEHFDDGGGWRYV